MTKINTSLDAHPEVRSALRVAVYTFLGIFVPAIMGWLADVNSWVDGDQDFPSLSALGKMAIAAFSATLSGMLAYVYNKLPGTKTAKYPEAIDTTSREV